MMLLTYEDDVCFECGLDPPTHEDPRTPPVEEGVVLCKDCCVNAHNEVIDELEAERDWHRKQLEDLGPE